MELIKVGGVKVIASKGEEDEDEGEGPGIRCWILVVSRACVGAYSGL